MAAVLSPVEFGFALVGLGIARRGPFLAVLACALALRDRPNLLFPCLGLIWLLCALREPVPRLGRALAWLLQLIALAGLARDPLSLPLRRLHTIGLLGVASFFPFCFSEQSVPRAAGQVLENFWFSATYLSLWLCVPPSYDLKTLIILLALTIPCHGLLCHRGAYLWQSLESLLLLSAALLFCPGCLLPTLRSGVPPALLALLLSAVLVRLVAGSAPDRLGLDLRRLKFRHALPFSLALLSLGVAPALLGALALPPLLCHHPAAAFVLFAALAVPLASILRWTVEPWRPEDHGAMARPAVSPATPVLFLVAALALWVPFLKKFLDQWK
ncbi:MAG: hypothetical protein LBT98_04275 [Puniceicoccales bacterium]|nr:hypothetical protein [Puniceicoccales bacterium]